MFDKLHKKWKRRKLDSTSLLLIAICECAFTYYKSKYSSKIFNKRVNRIQGDIPELAMKEMLNLGKKFANTLENFPEDTMIATLLDIQKEQNST